MQIAIKMDLNGKTKLGYLIELSLYYFTFVNSSKCLSICEDVKQLKFLNNSL